jgi:hypothetical protein
MVDKVEIIQGDGRDPGVVDRALVGVDIVVHAAAALLLYPREEILTPNTAARACAFRSCAPSRSSGPSVSGSWPCCTRGPATASTFPYWSAAETATSSWTSRTSARP